MNTTLEDKEDRMAGETATAQTEVVLRVEGTVAKLQLEPGDTLVVQLAGMMAPETMEAMRAELERRFPGIQVLITDPSVELTVVKPVDGNPYTEPELAAAWDQGRASGDDELCPHGDHREPTSTDTVALRVAWMHGHQAGIRERRKVSAA